MLKDIIAVKNKEGLFRIISKGVNKLIIESVSDKKRMSLFKNDSFIPLGDMSISTNNGEMPIGEALTLIKSKENGNPISSDLQKADYDALLSYMAEIVPNYNHKCVYPNEVRKLLKWYNLLITAGITDFS